MQCIAGFMKMCSPLVTHQRWLGLLLLLLCVGYSHGMPHVLRFGKSLLKHIPLITDAVFALVLLLFICHLKMSNARCCLSLEELKVLHVSVRICRERYFYKQNFLSPHHTCRSCLQVVTDAKPLQNSNAAAAYCILSYIFSCSILFLNVL